MTNLLTRTKGTGGEDEVETPSGHTHPGLIMFIFGGLILAAIAVAIGIGAVVLIPDDTGTGTDQSAATGQSTATAQTDTATQPATFESVIPDLVPKSELPLAPASEVNASYAPDAPPPSGRTSPAIIEVQFEVVENVVEIDSETGVEYETWGYRIIGDDSAATSGTPGPMIRGRVGDVMRFTVSNPEGNSHPHNIDLHAVTGQGGGAGDTVVAPGETKTIEARFLYPGFFMYHCAYGDVPLHISHGMYGGILVDPAEPLPEVDHEWYMVQSEFYTTADEPGLMETDRDAITNEEPTFVVFNGARGALAGDNALNMQVGERSRIYFVNAGLNLDSNFHPIGSHWDTVYQEASLITAPVRGSQTTLVPAGGGVVVELIGQVPSTIILVDHALSRTFDKGALGQIIVEGDANPEIFEAVGANDTSGGDEAAADTPADAIDVSILPGSGDTQPLGAADEFTDTESPADYSVNVLEIPVGTTVTWTNDDSVIHTVTAVDDSFESGFLAESESWSHTFGELGEYEYFCTPHPWMRAKVVVTS